jgi:hypothetical protein
MKNSWQHWPDFLPVTYYSLPITKCNSYGDNVCSVLSQTASCYLVIEGAKTKLLLVSLLPILSKPDLH